MEDFRNSMEQKYREIIKRYLEDPNEQVLYQGQKFSRKSIEYKIAPEEIISVHRSVLAELEPNMSQEVLESFDMLLEIMMAYGLAYREHQSLRNQQEEIRSEIEVAASMQQTLLKTTIPELDCVDIGAISVPAKYMSGDYYHFMQDENGRVGIGIADIIGKGIPAALCMSMIKYAVDSLPEKDHQPHTILENLNRVVEQNVDPSMFITMFYGVYEPTKHMFRYAAAGHEPGFYYHAKDKQFEDLEAKGLLLGVSKKTTYEEYEKQIEIGDLIILLSDGVTECRTSEGFIEREQLTECIAKYIHLSAQEIVENVYRELERLQSFQLRDDFTLIIFKRTA